MCACVCVCVGARASFLWSCFASDPSQNIMKSSSSFLESCSSWFNEAWGWWRGPCWGGVIKREVGYAMPTLAETLISPPPTWHSTLLSSVLEMQLLQNHISSTRNVYTRRCANVIAWVSLADGSFVKCKYWITEAKTEAKRNTFPYLLLTIYMT